MRAIVAEMMFGGSGDSLRDLEKYVPDLYVKNKVRDVVPAKFHVVKTHDLYTMKSKYEFERIIYLMRDPRDVVVSFYRYLTARGGYKGDFNQFLDDWLFGRIWPSSWTEHVNSWAGKAERENAYRIETVLYENLVANPIEELSRVARFLDLTIGKERLSDIIDNTSPTNMKHKEDKGVSEHEKKGNTRLVDKATSGGWNQHLTGKQARLIHEYAGNIMKKYGYV